MRLAVVLTLTVAVTLPAATDPPYNVLLGWDAGTESGVDAAWEPQHNPLAGAQVWTWNTTNRVSYRPVTSAAAPGLRAAFAFDAQDQATLTPNDPQALPLNPTDYSASFELWLRPARLDAGKQVIFSFGGKTDGASLTLEQDVLRFQFRDSDVRGGLDTNRPPDGVNDDGLEDLAASLKTRLTGTNEFLQVIAVIELGGTNPHAALYLNGALAPPLNDAETGLFKDESLVAVGSGFAPVTGTQGQNPLPLRVGANGPGASLLSPTDWSGNRVGRLGRQDGDIGGTADPSGGPLYLNDFQNTTFQGDIAVLNLYARALNARQVAALQGQVAQNRLPVASAHVTSGLQLNFEARLGALSGGSDWANSVAVKPAFATTNALKPASDALDWKFTVTDNRNLVTTNVSLYPLISAAYRFDGDSRDNGRLVGVLPDGSRWDSLVEIIGGGIAQTSVTFEVWFKPDDLSGKEVLLESGSDTNGMSLRLNGTSLELAVRHGSNPNPAERDVLVATPLNAGELASFIQAVGILDLAGHQARLFVNGALRGQSDFMSGLWSDGEADGLGGMEGTLGGGQGSGYGDFAGQIAVLRLYSRALSDAEVVSNYTAVLAGTLTNLPPTSLALNTPSMAENQPVGTLVGVLAATDPNAGDTHTFALVSGDGDDDNTAFTIVGADLMTAAVFDFESQNQYRLRIRAADQGGLAVEKSLVVSVDNLNEADARAAVPPNIIIYLCDDMGIGEAHPYYGKKLGPNAAPISKTLVTPHLDRLADLGTVFTDVHTASSMCSPTRYALLTGRYAWRTYNKHTVIGGWQARPMIAPQRPTLATLLRQHGYRTAAFGKWHLGWTFLTTNGTPMRYDSATEGTWATVRLGPAGGGGYVTSILDGPLAHGFDYFFGVSGNFANDSAGLLKAHIENNSILGIPTWGGAPPQAGKTCAGPGVVDWDQQRLGETYMNKALGYIDRHVAGGSNAPFFFYYAPNANHGPTDPAASIVVQGRTISIKGQSRYTDDSAGGNRTDMIYENNIAVGLFLDKLAAMTDPRTGRPMIQSTLFIFTSDNGPDATGVGQAGLRDRKTALYEGGHRVPFVVSWPDGGIPGGAINTANFGQFDLYASFADLLGHKLGVDEAEDSANVLPALLNQVTGPNFRRPYALVSHDDSLGSNDLPDDSALAIRAHPMVMLIDGKLVNRNKTAGASQGKANPIRLFDLDVDLHQDNDLLGHSHHSLLVASLAERLLLFHNRGFSRELGLTDCDQLLLTDGGADLRNDLGGALGYEFTTGDQPLAVESLGLWDDATADAPGNEIATLGDGQTTGIPDGLNTPHTIRLFDGSTQQIIASVTVSNGNSCLVGEFRFVDLPQPIMLNARKTYALTMSTASGDGDLFHHFAAFTGVTPSPTSRVTNFLARVAFADGAYPSLYPDGSDGADHRHPDMFRHRMFVGPNARLVPWRITSAVIVNTNVVLSFPAGTGMSYRLEATSTLNPPDWQPVQSGIAGTNGIATMVVPGSPGLPQRFFRLVTE